MNDREERAGSSCASVSGKCNHDSDDNDPKCDDNSMLNADDDQRIMNVVSDEDEHYEFCRMMLRESNTRAKEAAKKLGIKKHSRIVERERLQQPESIDDGEKS